MKWIQESNYMQTGFALIYEKLICYGQHLLFCAYIFGPCLLQGLFHSVSRLRGRNGAIHAWGLNLMLVITAPSTRSCSMPLLLLIFNEVWVIWLRDRRMRRTKMKGITLFWTLGPQKMPFSQDPDMCLIWGNCKGGQSAQVVAHMRKDKFNLLRTRFYSWAYMGLEWRQETGKIVVNLMRLSAGWCVSFQRHPILYSSHTQLPPP